MNYSRIVSLPIKLCLFSIFLFLGSCGGNNIEELGDGKIEVSISSNPVYVINSSDFSCASVVQKNPDGSMTSDINPPRITIPPIRVTWNSPTQTLKIHNAYIVIKFLNGTTSQFPIRLLPYASTITPGYFVDTLNGDCNGKLISTFDGFDGRKSTDPQLALDRCNFVGHQDNTYAQVCPFKAGGLPALTMWKSERALVTAYLFLQGSSVERTPKDPISPGEYPWATKVAFTIKNPCTDFPDICKQ